ncbi:MAG TPA: response regulator [Rhodocyclaceae bacterium]|nr:response regulator [Rhodocyclaceae bacterium]
MKPPPLRLRLLALVLLAVVPTFALIAFTARQDWVAAEAEAQRMTREAATLVANEDRRLIEQTRNTLAVLASVPYITAPELLSMCRRSLPQFLRQNPLYANVGVVDAQGNLLCSGRPFAGRVNFADRQWFKRTVAQRDFAVGEYLIGRLTSIPSLGMGYPVYGPDGRLSRVIYITLDLSWLRKLAADLPLPDDTAVVIVDAGGTILARQPDPKGEWLGKQAPVSKGLQAMLAAGCRGYAEFAGQDGVMRLNAVEPLQMVGDNCVYVRVGLARDMVYGQVRQHLRRDLTALVIVSLIIFAVAWFGGDRIILRPVRALALATRRLGEGNLATRTGLPHTEDELGRLAKGFDDMAAAIEARDRSLAESERTQRRANRALSVLSAGNHTMLRATDEQALLQDMCLAVVERGGYRMAWVGYAMDDAERSVKPMAGCGVDAGYLAAANISWADAERGRGPTGSAIRERRIVVNRNFLTDPKLAPWREAALKHGYASSIALPLQLNGAHSLGALTIYSAEADAFDDAEIALLAESAADLAFGIGRLRDQAQRQEAEQANRIKSEFLANMSHELRTPLNAIIGFSDVLKDGLLGELAPAQREYVTDINDSGRHLLSLINDILDLSKVEAGRMDLALAETSVAALLANSLSVVREKAAAHGIALEQEVADLAEPISVDGRKTKQIVFNLLSNAIKFTPDGGRIRLRARRATRADVEQWVPDRTISRSLPLPENDFREFLEIQVEDSGVGIAADDAPRLFQPFSQLGNTFARRDEGTGLGLAMVMKIAELHGGTAAVSSEPGKGSCFTVWLPWRQSAAVSSAPAALPVPPAAAAAAEERLILVIEDDQAAADILRLQLEVDGFYVLRVPSAEAALALMDARHPSVIILDIFLPAMDGWEFLARIKAPASPWADVPVVIASVAAESQRGFALGAAQVLQKPVGRNELAAALGRLGLGPPSGKDCKVLIVDDDPKAVELLAAYLSEPGYRVLRAYDGRAGLAAAREELPDLLVLDLTMPEMSGFEVIQALQADAATAAIPVIVVSARELAAAERAQLDGGIAAVLAKTEITRGSFATEVWRILRPHD